MRTAALFILTVMLVPGAWCQDDQRLSEKEIRQFQKEQKQSEKKAAAEARAKEVEDMVKMQRFVLVADYVSDKDGSRASVRPGTNFLIIDSLKGSLQIEPEWATARSGVTGSILPGNIIKYEYRTTGRKKNAWSISMNYATAYGNYDITLTVKPDGYADAVIRGNTDRFRISAIGRQTGIVNMYGKLELVSEARIYKGHTTF